MAVQIKNTFYQYGIVAKVFNWLKVIFIILIYIYQLQIIITGNNNIYNSQAKCWYLLFVVTILNIIWNIFNRIPMSLATTIAEEIIDKILSVLSYIFIICSATLVILLYCVYVVHSMEGNHISYQGMQLFNITILPASFIKGYANSILYIVGVDKPMIFYNQLIVPVQVLVVILLPIVLLTQVSTTLFNQFVRKNEIIQRKYFF